VFGFILLHDDEDFPPLEASVTPVHLRLIAQIVLSIASTTGFLEGFPDIEHVITARSTIEATFTIENVSEFLEGNASIDNIDEAEEAEESQGLQGKNIVLGGK